MAKNEILRCRVNTELKEKFNVIREDFNRKNNLELTESEFLRKIVVEYLQK